MSVIRVAMSVIRVTASVIRVHGSVAPRAEECDARAAECNSRTGERDSRDAECNSRTQECDSRPGTVIPLAGEGDSHARKRDSHSPGAQNGLAGVHHRGSSQRDMHSRTKFIRPGTWLKPRGTRLTSPERPDWITLKQ